jgi:hypothetical protein
MSCLRMSPLFGVALVALRGRWLVGLVTGSGGRGAAAAQPLSAQPWTMGLLRGGGSSVSQFFVWVYVVLGVIVGVTALSAVLNWMIEEFKLHRECTRPRSRQRR